MKSSFLRATCTGIFVISSVGIGRAQAPPAPTGLNSQVVGNLVTVSWNPSPGAVSYVIQVGLSSGASNVFNGNIGNATSASGTAGNGQYFWRVLAIGPSGASSPPSAEAQFTVGGGGCVPPGPPQGFTASVAGVRVTLRWSQGSGGAPTTYVIEAGSGPGLANLFNAPTGNAGTELSVDAPPGTYFARLRAQNGCGTSGVSNEQMIVVGGGPDPCSFAVSPASVNVPLAGGPIQVNVTAPGGCRWQLQSDPFIVPTSTPSGSGSTSVGYMVTGTTTPRTGQILLQGLDPGPVTAPQVLVQQVAPTSCAVTFNPTSHTVEALSAVYEFRVNTNPGCAWTVAPLAGFLSIVSAGSGMGSDGVRYLVATNASIADRSGLIRVTSSTGPQDFSVTQRGNPPPVASFVMRQGGGVTTVCQVNQGQPCTLDGSASTPAAQITSYEWTTVRFRLGQDLVDNYTGVNPTLSLPCTVGGNSQETFDVTLTVRNALGQSNTLTRRLSLIRAGCGT